MRAPTHLVLALAAALPVLLLPRGAQDASGAAPASVEEASPSLPEGIAALVGDRLIVTMDEYADYLVRKSGRKPLEDLIHLRLLEERARELGIEVDPAEAQAEAEGTWDDLVQARHRGDELAMLRELAENGFDREGYLANMAEMRRREELERQIVLATRAPDDAALRARFEADFGEGGIRVQVRHVLVAPAREKARQLRAGTPVEQLTGPRLARLTEERVAELKARLEGGEDFESLARAESDDLSARQTGGFLAGYNYQRYGEDFAEAVRAAEVGALVGPLQTPAGHHLIEVTERTTTEFESVRDELMQRVLTAEVSPAERFGLRRSLVEGLPIQTY